MDAIVTRYRKPLISFFRRHLQNYWDAEELVQEVFCKLLKRNDLDEHGNQESYLYTIAWNVLRDKARADRVRHRDSHLEFDEELANPVDGYLEQAVDSQKLYRRYINALNDLPPKNRHMFILNRYEEATYKDIAKRYGISASQVEKYMIHTLALLRNALGYRSGKHNQMAGKRSANTESVINKRIPKAGQV